MHCSPPQSTTPRGRKSNQTAVYIELDVGQVDIGQMAGTASEKVKVVHFNFNNFWQEFPNVLYVNVVSNRKTMLPASHCALHATATTTPSCARNVKIVPGELACVVIF